MTKEEEAARRLAEEAQRNIDTGRNRRVNTAEDLRRKVEDDKFLIAIREKFGIKTIYYPGCSDDKALEPAFHQSSIFYLDRAVDRSRTTMKGFVGDFTDPPPEIKNTRFDAVFIKDLDLQDQKNGEAILLTILQALKEGGILIYGIRKKCPKWQEELKFMEKQRPGVLALDTTSEIEHNPNFRVFMVTKPS
jgi:SAM-dependent methyltransferase